MFYFYDQKSKICIQQSFSIFHFLVISLNHAQVVFYFRHNRKKKTIMSPWITINLTKHFSTTINLNWCRLSQLIRKTNKTTNDGLVKKAILMPTEKQNKKRYSSFFFIAISWILSSLYSLTHRYTIDPMNEQCSIGTVIVYRNSHRFVHRNVLCEVMMKASLVTYSSVEIQTMITLQKSEIICPVWHKMKENWL